MRANEAFHKREVGDLKEEIKQKETRINEYVQKIELLEIRKAAEEAEEEEEKKEV